VTRRRIFREERSKKENRTDNMNKEDVMTGKGKLNQIYGMKFDVYILIRSHTNKYFRTPRHRQLNIHSFIRSFIPLTYSSIHLFHLFIDLSTCLSACLPAFLSLIKVD
jgi:hypothetical protein